jgi:hypothetical protein
MQDSQSNADLQASLNELIDKDYVPFLIYLHLYVCYLKEKDNSVSFYVLQTLLAQIPVDSPA